MKLTIFSKTDALVLKKLRHCPKSEPIKIFAHFGSFTLVLLFIVVVFFLPINNNIIISSTSLLSIILDTIIVFLIKYTVRRKRIIKPQGLKYTYDPYSFPSGHISRLVALTCCCYSNIVLLSIMILITALCFISRLITEYHYFSDCFAGAIIGIISAVVCIYLVQQSFIPVNYILNEIGLYKI